METETKIDNVLQIVDQITESLWEAKSLWYYLIIQMRKHELPLPQTVHPRFDRGAVEWKDLGVLLLLTPDHQWKVAKKDQPEETFAGKETRECAACLKRVLSTECTRSTEKAE